MGIEHKEINTAGQTKIGEWPLTVGLTALRQFLFFLKQKMKEKRVAKLGNRGFGLSTDHFLKSVKKFLVKKVRTIPINSHSRPPQYPRLLLWFISRC